MTHVEIGTVKMYRVWHNGKVVFETLDSQEAHQKAEELKEKS